MHKSLTLSLLIVVGCYGPQVPQGANGGVSTDTRPTDEAPESIGEFTGKVVGIVDGDTIDVLTEDHRTVRIRFNGIDCPERGQPFGNTARDWVSDVIGGEDVRIVVTDTDRYGRTVGDVFHADVRINTSLVKNGLAWHYVKYAPDDDALRDAQQHARESKAGLWSDPRHVAPWDWRKLSKEERDKLR